MKNERITDLDAGQAFKRTLDFHRDAVRVVQLDNGEEKHYALDLDAECGDSVLSVKPNIWAKTSVEAGQIGIVIHPLQCKGIEQARLYTSLSRMQEAMPYIEISPDDEGEFWISERTSFDSSPLKSDFIHIMANRIRVCMPMPLQTPFDIFLLGQ